MKEKPLIVHIEDELSSTEEYPQYLEEQGATVKVIPTADEALDWMAAHHAEVACVILDIMLPLGSRYNGPSTDFGLLTGLAVYRDLRVLYRSDLMIFILTNNTDPVIIEKTAADSRVQVILKESVLFDEFGDLVLNYLKAAHA